MLTYAYEAYALEVSLSDDPSEFTNAAAWKAAKDRRDQITEKVHWMYMNMDMCSRHLSVHVSDQHHQQLLRWTVDVSKLKNTSGQMRK